MIHKVEKRNEISNNLNHNESNYFPPKRKLVYPKEYEEEDKKILNKKEKRSFQDILSQENKK